MTLNRYLIYADNRDEAIKVVREIEHEARTLGALLWG